MFPTLTTLLSNNVHLPLHSYMNDWYLDSIVINDIVHLRVYEWKYNAGWHVTHEESYQASSNEEATSIGTAIDCVCNIFANSHK